MSDALQTYIANCKKPKAVAKVKKIVEKMLKGFRLEYSSQVIADKMNSIGVYTLMGKRWTASSLQMQALKMCRFDGGSSLAWGFAEAIRAGEASQADIDLIKARTRKQ